MGIAIYFIFFCSGYLKQVAQFKKHMYWYLYVYGRCARYVIYCTVGLIRIIIYSSSSTQSRRTWYDILLSPNNADGQNMHFFYS